MPSKKYNNTKRREKSGGDNEIFGIVLVIISAFIFLCITIRPILGIISRGIYNVTTGVFGLFSYPLFLSTLLWGIALIQGRSANLSVRVKAGIACMILSLLLILQLATTHSQLDNSFSSYISYVYAHKKSAGGVLFGVIAYGVQSVTTPVVSYILYSLLFASALGLCVLWPIYAKRKGGKEQPQQPVNPFVKGMAAPQQTKPLGDTSLFVDTIRPVPPAPQDEGNKPLAALTENTPHTAIATAPQTSSRDAAGVQFAPYSEKRSSHEGYPSAAHKILFGDTYNALPKPAPAPPIDFGKMRDEYNRTVLPPVVSAGPDIRDVTAPLPPVQKEEPPAKPQKRVHGGLGEVPQVPEKDFSDRIVGGSGIINGDDYSRKLAEDMAPIGKETAAEQPKAGEFATRKIDLTPVQPKVTQEPPQSSIVNGDYFGAPVKQAAQPSSASIYSSAREQIQSSSALFADDDTQDNVSDEPYTAPQEPIVRGSVFEREHSVENRFLAQLDADRKRAEQSFVAQTDKPIEPARQDVFASDDIFSATPLPNDEQDNSLLADELPVEPRGSAFRIIEEPVDLSEQSHFEGDDNTGYYDTVSVKDIKPVAKQPVLRMENQLKIDDYVAQTPPPPKPKKKKRLRYNAPDIDMLVSSDSSVPENFNVACEERARMLEGTLQELKLPVKVTGITRGPAVTRFELEMPPGIPIKRIEQFSTDIEYYLASNGKIRIEAPIPGKRAVGIEVPNEEIDIVRLREIIESKDFQNSSSPLTLALGKDIAGSNIICNLEKMPHLLIAGATGSGKSACLNSIIISILYKSSPEDVRLILIDPKRVEFNMYQGIPHLLGSEIVNDAQQAINVLTWAKEEMDRRYTLFGNHRVRNLPEFNKSDAVKSGEEQKLPYIVLIVDELAELMLDNNKKVLENKIMSIAQKARAAGIHMILATQRPSVDVITGTIKANLPSRIAFSVKSIVDSRTILDECGAETLLGRGDMLYSPVGMDDPKRVQGAFVTDKEVLTVSEYVRDNNEADFDEEFTAAIAKREDETETDGDEDDDPKEFDSLMPEVLKCVIESGSASTSMIQRRFSVGYARASRIIDQMEVHKFIGPLEGSKPRPVYISREQYKELFGIDL